ncbi:TlpA family protein disulfide reductase [Hamadaea tsunoensis]|uniref:TlpA family protein disulfide reductase n=1 Tax=Hamadaea tsunoensis TaxID=53368 RepID=UPI00041EF949|nr:TlpA disulfide reductase family protein [Hamadaea tsunoensis]
MAVLTAATVFTVALTLVNLLLLLGVIRRLREPSAAGPVSGALVMARAGSRPATVTAYAVDGTVVSHDDLAGKLLGFFTPGCPACVERLPEFLARARRRSPDQVVAVLVGEPEELTDMVGRLRGIAQVVVEPPQGPVAEAFEVQGFPAVALLDAAGTVAFSSTDFRGFPAEAAAPHHPVPVGAHD